MGFFKKLFKKKKGGTVLGNTLRKLGNAASNKLTGGLIKFDNFNRIKGDEVNQVLSNPNVPQKQKRQLENVVSKGREIYPNNVNDIVDAGARGIFKKPWYEKYMGALIAGGVAVIGFVAWMFGGKKK